MRQGNKRSVLARTLGGGGAALLAAALVTAAAPGAGAAAISRPPAALPGLGGGQLTNHGGPVQTAPKLYLDFWDWTSDPNGEQAYLTSFLESIGGTAWLNTVTQYGGGAQPNLLSGIWQDSTPIPASPSDAQIQAEAVAAANHFNAGTSVNVQIIVATPPSHSTPGFGTTFCSYHGVVAADPNITYTDLPYQSDAPSFCHKGVVNGASGALDGVGIDEGHELAETITDPLISAWFDGSGFEVADKCQNGPYVDIVTSAGLFAVQPLWSNAAVGCVLATSSSSSPFEFAYPDYPNGELWSDGADHGEAWSQTVAAGTSPAIAHLTNGGYEIAFQGSNGDLWTAGSAGTRDWGVAMAAGTSPAITALPGTGYEAAVEASTDVLWIAGTAGTTNEGFGMAAGTSPSITTLSGGGLEMAFQANNGILWTVGTDNHDSWGIQMGLHTSPSITALSSNGYDVAVQASSGTLWLAGSGGTVNEGYGMASGTSPSIATETTGAVEMAFQANTGALWTVGADNHDSWGIQLAVHTSPSITALASGGYEAAAVASSTALWTVGSAGTTDWGYPLIAGASPGMAP